MLLLSLLLGNQLGQVFLSCPKGTLPQVAEAWGRAWQSLGQDTGKQGMGR